MLNNAKARVGERVVLAGVTTGLIMMPILMLAWRTEFVNVGFRVLAVSVTLFVLSLISLQRMVTREAYAVPITSLTCILAVTAAVLAPKHLVPANIVIASGHVLMLIAAAEESGGFRKMFNMEIERAGLPVFMLLSVWVARASAATVIGFLLKAIIEQLSKVPSPQELALVPYLGSWGALACYIAALALSFYVNQSESRWRSTWLLVLAILGMIMSATQGPIVLVSGFAVVLFAIVTAAASGVFKEKSVGLHGIEAGN